MNLIAQIVDDVLTIPFLEGKTSNVTIDLILPLQDGGSVNVSFVNGTITNYILL